MRALHVASLSLGVWAGCAPPPPPPADVLATRILSGDIDGAVIALRTEEAPEVARWRENADRLAALGEERAAVRAVERGMLRDAAAEALERGDPSGALPALRAGLRITPEDPDLQGLLRELLARLDGAAPADTLHIYAELRDAALPGLPVDLDERVERATLAVRYGPARRADTLRGLEGVTAQGAAHLLGQIDAEYYTPPDWGAVASAGTQRVARLMAHADRPPAALTPTPGSDLAGAVRGLEALLSATEGCGLPPEAIIAEWVEAGLGALDPWTRAVWPAEIASWQAHHDGVSYGVGLTLHGTDAGSVFIDRPRLNTPAWTSGLRQGDRIDRIDQLVLSVLPPEQRLAAAEAALLGDAGTTAELSVTRLEAGELVFRLERGPVKLETLEGLERTADNRWQLWLDEPSGLAYVRLLGFRDYTEPDFDALLGPLAEGMQGLVLDLRSNPGGDLNASVQIADRFVESGVLAELRGRKPPETTPAVDPQTGEELVPWNHAIQGHALEGVAVVALVDRDSASAAEILSGVLQERAGAVVLGAPTWGKGYTQVLRHEPEQGYAVQFTNQIWTLPSGRQVLDGITPDIALEMGPGEVFQANLLARQRAALKVHADGTPMEWMDTTRREDLPPLSDDPAIVTGELVLRALVHQRAQGAP